MAIEIQQKKLGEEEKRNNALQQDLALTIEQRDSSNKEIRRLQKEVISLTHDVKELQSELQKTKICRDNFKRKCQEYCRTLEGLSISITKKDKVQDTLAQQYLSLAETISSLQMLNSTIKEGEDACKQKQQMRINEMVENFKEERDQLMTQVNEVLSKNEELESHCHRLETEKYKLEESLLSARDATQKEESKRNEAECENKRLSILLEKVLEEKRTLQHQVESLSSQLQSEQRALHSVEEMLSEKRKKEFTSDSLIQELQVEKAQLQRKISELTSDLEHELEEVKRLRNHSASLELEKDRLKQQLSMEQYDRERMSQELRRVRKYSQMEEILSSADNGGTKPSGFATESPYKTFTNGSPTSRRPLSRSPSLFASAQVESSPERP
ncbi:Centrosomal protein, partial [Armadillidium nasatum]